MFNEVLIISTRYRLIDIILIFIFMTRSLFRENGLFMNVNIYQHILMYSSFIVSGIFDLLSMLFPDISHSIGSNSIEKVC